MGQTHVQSYMKSLLELIQRSSFDPSFIITHRGRLTDAPELYETFKRKQDNCIKVVMQP
jgi:threonine dehydrogenase-like Zn-dependent dehydrogenase